MKSLFDYEFLVNEVFYRCQPILKWIENNKNMSELDREAIQATIMDALVYKGLIDPTKESLDLDHLCIVNNLEHYVYNEHPNVSGIPQWMKEEFRKKCIKITAGIPISLYLSKPSTKHEGARYCVYDRNTAVSAIFSSANFYDVYYNSPTRNKPIESPRPFVEVEINNELYLIDILTKRIFKSSYFKEKFGFKIVKESKLSEIDEERLKMYNDFITEEKGLSTMIPFILMGLESSNDNLAEMNYELEKSKQYYPEEWDKYEYEKIEMENFFRLSKNKN